MHPGFSIILFTTASGAGFGLLALAGFLVGLGALPGSEGSAWAISAAGFGLAVGGLLSSVAHLGRPERAWRAFSQWRTSWLSREGIAAVATLGAAALFAAAWILGDSPPGILARFLGFVTAGCAGLTVITTGMIYASLKPVRQWHHPLVVPGYVALAAMSGALLLNALLRLAGGGSPSVAVIALVSILLALGLKEWYWRAALPAGLAATRESATGLGSLGRVRVLDPPHTEENYLLREMGFHVGRKHAHRLRVTARLLAFALPFGLVLASLAAGPWGTAAALLAPLVAAPGLLAERWLFFAEATHTVTLYYR